MKFFFKLEGDPVMKLDVTLVVVLLLLCIFYYYIIGSS